MTEDIETIRGKTLPDALKSIQESKETLDKIVSYYVDTKSTEYEKFFQQTQDYTKEAITNVAYHAHTVGTHLTNFLKLQLLELEKLELHLCTLADVHSFRCLCSSVKHVPNYESSTWFYLSSRNKYYRECGSVTIVRVSWVTEPLRL
jgi:hypothetical protein